MTILITRSLVVASLLLLSLPLYAQTYQYVDTNRNLQTVVANNPTEAIAIAKNRHPNSGVMTSSGYPITNTSIVQSISGNKIYGYIDTKGVLRTVVASSPTLALTIAPNRATHSGVMLMSK